MCGSVAAGEEGLFPFVVAYDTPANATNVSAWLDRPAGVHGFIRVEGGHLKNDAGPVRFWATNICFEACFPTHQQAERLAARLARLKILFFRAVVRGELRFRSGLEARPIKGRPV